MLTPRQRLLVFFATILFGLVVTFNSAANDFKSWIVDALLVAAISGFIVVKWLQYKGKWPKRGQD